VLVKLNVPVVEVIELWRGGEPTPGQRQKRALGLALARGCVHTLAVNNYSTRAQPKPGRRTTALSAVLVTLCWLVGSSFGVVAGPVIRMLKAGPTGRELLVNSDFEQATEGRARAWAPAPKGFVVAIKEGRNESRAARCDNPDGRGWYGASQTVTLNQTIAHPFLVEGWSKAANVDGSPDPDYCLYVDIVYADGSPLWGQTAVFPTGTHGWEHRERMILPEKPVKSLTLYCLFRYHRGTAWFDDVSVKELRPEGSAVLFQGVPVIAGQGARSSPAASGPGELRLATSDGLSLALRDNTIVSLKVDGKELAADAPSGFLARDVGANSDLSGFSSGECAELGLTLKTQIQSHPGHISIQGRLSDTRGQNRAVTLVFALPLDALGWNWEDDIRHHRLIQGNQEFSKQVSINCGATGTMSLYPLAALVSDHEGLALAIDMACPAQYRLGYHPALKQFFIAYDFGLVPDTERFPRSADFRFVLYRFDPRWGFRAAFQKLTTLFPDYFLVRSGDQGLWMPFTDIATVHGWEDFGFKYHEGNNNVPWDDAHGVLSFRYTEPMTWWMRMPKDSPRTIQEAARQRDALAQSTRGTERKMAQVSQIAGMWDESGQPSLLFRDEPWCNGAVWSLNPNPFLPTGTGSVPAGERSTSEAGGLNAATVHWNETIQRGLYGATAKGQLDGEYLDSLEGYVTADLNFRRDHFRYTTVPLTFDSDSKRPALFKGLAVFEFTRWFCEEVHRLGKLTFANGVPYRFTFLCPWLDVLGTETGRIDLVHRTTRPVASLGLCEFLQ